ncbi:MAG TPA: undecaprenyldiphospho-muramoylpentapeptide beta-N-acetylglucosaminyltransferase [Steroidobacteraceae bacterium]|nr:undecaprenyldiphospho-muramoylpentapeptide beta-N-acetylglucosaminyltransferase [Steroidobacteraceae bacterium]
MSTAPVMIMAGGTGGHVFPALALARLLRQRRREVIWLGTRRGIEARVVPADGFPVEWLAVGGLRGKGVLTLLAAPFNLLRALWQALAIMWRHQPAVVVGLGGFVTGPGGLAAWLLRRPLVIHEQNAVAGFTNRCLAHLARSVLTAFPAAFAGRPRVRMIGNPVRADIAALPAPVQRFAGRDGPLHLLVIGGSLGARRLNEVVPQALALLATQARAPRFAVRHQAGEKLIDAARAAYAAAGASGAVTPFIADMAEALGWADLVVCRAGALTIAELAAAGVGAVLVPFPHAVDDHQTVNAQYLVAAGAARCLNDGVLTPQLLAGTLTELCAGGRDGLLRLAEAARHVARPAAAQDLLAAVLAAESA